MRRIGVLVGACLLCLAARAQTPSVAPTAETEPVPAGPLLPTLWVSPVDAGADRIFSSDGNGNLYAYRPDGGFVSLSSGGFGAAAIVYGVPLAGVPTDVIAVLSTSGKFVSLMPLDSASGALGPASVVSDVLAQSASALARIAAYRSPVDGAHYLFISDATGNLEQWRVLDDGAGKPTAQKVDRGSLALGEGLGGLVADDGRQSVYLTGQSTGLWRFDAEPDGGGLLTVDSTVGVNLIAPLGGVAIYRVPDAGYLLAASGDGAFAVYRGGAATAADYLTRFNVGGDGGGIEGVQGTVGLAVESFRVGAAARGLLVAHDALRADGGENLVLVPWESVATATGLSADGGVDPHGVTDGGPDAGGDGGTGADAGADGGTATGGSAGGGIPAEGPGATPPSSGCGCSGGGAALGGLGFLALLALVQRRRCRT